MKTSTVHFYLLGLTYLFFYVPTVAFSNDYSNKATYFFDDSILNYSDTQLPILDDSELFDRNCDTIQVHIRNNELIVDNLVRPNTHVKIFDKDYNLVFECLGDCGTSIIFPNLNSGEIYRTNIQVYDENWGLVCEDMKEVVLEGTNEPCPSSDCQDLISLCESIAINTEDNRIILSNLATVPNKVIKVFDEDYNIVYQCASNCVEKQQLVSAFSNGTYIVDIQLYDENWENICSERRTINLENDGEPCDTSICTGDIIINTQAEIDAFCGCEVIKGNLLIGDRLGEVRDIFSLANFSGLKRIEGIFSVVQTQIEDFTGLEELTFIGGGFAALFNPNLTSFKGLEKVQRIPENIAIFNNVALKDVSNFESLTEVGVQIIIEDNDNLTKIEGFSNLTSIGNNINSMSIRAISISRNTQLKTINAFQNVQTLENLFVSVNINLEHFAGFDNLREIGTLGINNNNRLRQIDFGDNLQSILTNIIVENNSLLEDCCVFQDLLDSDAENGQILGDINISQNFRGCNSSNDILQRCETTTTATCEDIQIETMNDSLIISGLSAPNAIVKLFDENYQIVFSCTGDCAETTIINSLIGGQIYYTDIQFYDENWNFICEDKQAIDFPFPDLCSEAICLGDVILRTQVDLDAFCGCEVIEGDLIIAPEGPIINDEDLPPAEITDISSLGNLKEVKGTVNLTNTLLTNLIPLSNLKTVGGEFSLQRHNELESLEGLENLESVGGFLQFLLVPKLKNLDDLKNIKRIGALNLIGNNIENIEQLNQLEVTTLKDLLIVDSEKLKSLEGLNGITNLGISGNILFANNAALENLNALQGVTEIMGNLIIRDNPSLNDCCGIAHLIDEDITNGITTGNVTIADNPSFCSATFEVIDNCAPSTSPSCSQIQIETTTNQITVSNLIAPIEILKIFDADYNKIYECFADCQETISVSDLSSGTYHLVVNFYDEDWKEICELNQTVQLGALDRANNLPIIDFFIAPNPAQSEVFLNLEPLIGKEVTLQLHNQFGQLLYQKEIEKVSGNQEKIDLTLLDNGLYFIKIRAEGSRILSKKLLVNKLY